MRFPGPPRRGRSAGFTLFELVVSLAIIVVLIGVFLHRFLTLQEIAERTAMEQTAVALRAGLSTHIASLIVNGRLDEIAQLEAANPFRLMAKRQANYLGELDDGPSATVAPGHWYFDRRRSQVVYVVASRGFGADERRGRRIRFAVRVARRAAGVTNETFEVTLQPVEPFEWLIN